MNVLLHNATGNKTAWYANITDYIYLANLPTSLTRIIPFAGTEQFSVWEGVGEDPDESIWDAIKDYGSKIQNVVVDTITSGYEYVASGDFLDDLVYVLSGEWMMGAAEAVGDGSGEIKEAVVEAMVFVLDWLIGKVQYLYNSLVLPLFSAARSYSLGILDAFQNYVNEISWFRDETYQKAPQSERDFHDQSTKDAQLSIISSMLGGSALPFKVMNGMNYIVTIIEPFSSLVDPQILISFALNSAPDFIRDKFQRIMEVEDLCEDAVGTITKVFFSEMFGGGPDSNSFLAALGANGNITVSWNYTNLYEAGLNQWNETTGNDSFIGKIWDNLTDAVNPPDGSPDVIVNQTEEIPVWEYIINLIVGIILISLEFKISNFLEGKIKTALENYKKDDQKVGSKYDPVNDKSVYHILWMICQFLPVVSLCLNVVLEVEEAKAKLENRTFTYEWAKPIPLVLGITGQILFGIFFFKANANGLKLPEPLIKPFITTNVVLGAMNLGIIMFFLEWISYR